MRADLNALGLDPEALLTETIFNVRFRPEDVERPETPGGLLIEGFIGHWTSNTHYVLLDDRAPTLAVPPRGRRAVSTRRLVLRTSERKGDTANHREVEARSVELRQHHILEYACWPDGQLATEWVIVASHAPTLEATAYLANLTKRFRLPVRYQQGRL